VEGTPPIALGRMWVPGGITGADNGGGIIEAGEGGCTVWHLWTGCLVAIRARAAVYTGGNGWYPLSPTAILSQLGSCGMSVGPNL
jgi:hypothetical protein